MSDRPDILSTCGVNPCFRLSLEMNDDRVVVTWDNSTTLLDIFVPVCMDFEKADCELNVGGEHQLVITVPIVVL